jgi:hypothetical protein
MPRLNQRKIRIINIQRIQIKRKANSLKIKVIIIDIFIALI